MKIKVMTFNLRVRSDKDGNNCFDLRKGKVLDVIRRESPDLIGFQEATDPMLDWLKESLSEYYVLGHGRGADYHGEGTPIAYKKNRFDLHAFREEWLSAEPQKPASVFEGLDQSKYPRVLLCAELVAKEIDTPIAFFNIHTDHRGMMARVAECSILVREMAASRFGFVVTGDFNALPNSPEIGLVTATEPSLGTVDATREIVGSFHGFRGDVGTHKIDYIFTNLPTDPAASYAIADDDSCGHYYSDHNALCAWVEIRGI